MPYVNNNYFTIKCAGKNIQCKLDFTMQLFV